MYKSAIIALLLICLSTATVFAHPGNTASDGCHYCRTNCDSWGVAWNERHCHGGYVAPIMATPIPTPTNQQSPAPTKRPITRPTQVPTATPTSATLHGVLGKSIDSTPTATPALVENAQTEDRIGFWGRIFGWSRQNNHTSTRVGFWSWFFGQ